MALNGDANVGDVGFQIFLATGVDVSGASSLAIRYRKPDGTEGEWAATATTLNGQDGIQHVTAAASELDQAGVWHLQAEVTGVSGFTGTGDRTTMQVGRPLPGA